MFPSIKGTDDHLSMLAIRSRDMNNFYLGIREDFIIADIRFG
jgi:hypothetical protein